MNKIIINADDFGRSHEINSAIIKSFQGKLISSATLIPNMDGFDDAIELINRYCLNGKVGIHINISEGKPLTEQIKSISFFCDQDGNFKNEKFNSRRFFRFPNLKEIDALKVEINAQIDKCKNYGLSITHLDSHHHKHIELYMLILLSRILKNNNINNTRIARIGNPYKINFKSLYRQICNVYLRNAINKKRVDTFISFNDLKYLKDDNKVVEIMCHPKLKDGIIMEGNRPLSEMINELNHKVKYKLINY